MHVSDISGALLLPPVLDLTRAESLHGDLQAWMAENSTVRLDGHAVERVSTACLQLMAAAAVTAQAEGRVFQIVMPSEVLLHATRDLGLSDILLRETP